LRMEGKVMIFCFASDRGTSTPVAVLREIR